MNHLVQFQSCPCCKSVRLEKVLQLKDYSISQESFDLYSCMDCGCRITQNVPCETAIQRYYAADNYISHSDTRTGLINKLYHLARKITLRSKLRIIQQVTGRTTGMLLDLGCGTGSFLNHMATKGWSAIGLEPDPQARKVASQRYNADVYPSDQLFQLPDETYHAITLWHVLEHVHRLDETIEQLSKILTKEGKLIVAVPNYKSHDAMHYGAHWAAYDVPRHLYHFSPQSIKLLMQRHHLKVVRTYPMWLDSFYVSMLSERYKGGNMIKAILQGILSNIVALFQKERCSSLIYIIEKGK